MDAKEKELLERIKKQGFRLTITVNEATVRIEMIGTLDQDSTRLIVGTIEEAKARIIETVLKADPTNEQTVKINLNDKNKVN